MPRFVEGIYFSPDDGSGATPELTSPLPQEYVNLRFDSQVKRAIGSALRVGRGKPGTAAVEELVDNIFDAVVVSPDQTTLAVVTLPSGNPRGYSWDKLRVEGLNEEGMDAEGLRTMLTVGKSTGKGAATYGIGAQEAMMGAGKDVVIVAKRRGDKIEYRFMEPGYGDPEVPYDGKRPIQSQVAADERIGRVDITVSSLHLRKEEFPGKAELVRELSERYGPRLVEEPVKFDRRAQYKAAPRNFIDAEGNPVRLHDRAVLFVVGSKKTEQVFPPDYQLVPGCSQELQVTRTSEGEPVPFWIGEKKPEAKDVDPGFRYYVSGVQIHRGGLAGHETKDPRLQRLVGGVHGDGIKDFKQRVLALSKSAASINTNAPEWQRLEAAVHRAIGPLVEEIRQRPSETDAKVPRNLQQALQLARRIGDMAVAETIAVSTLTQGVVTKASGEAGRGQRPSMKKPGSEPEGREGLGIQLDGKPWVEQSGQTFPLPGSNSDIPRKRKGVVSDARTMPFGKEDSRISSVATEGTRKTLLLNADHDRVAHLLALMDIDPPDGLKEMTWLAAEELVAHAVAELGLSEPDQVFQKIADGRHAVARLMRKDATTQFIESRPPAAGGGKKKKK